MNLNIPGMLAPSSTFLRFCVIGAVGFGTDAGILVLMVHLAHADPLAARFASFAVAVFVTFELNRRWTFAFGADRSYRALLASYLGVQGLGFVCNFAIYSMLYLLLRPAPSAPLVALLIASAVALLVNYAGARIVVFRKKPARPRSFI